MHLRGQEIPKARTGVRVSSRRRRGMPTNFEIILEFCDPYTSRTIHTTVTISRRYKSNHDYQIWELLTYRINNTISALSIIRNSIPDLQCDSKWQRKTRPKKNQTRIIGLLFGAQMNTLVKWIECFLTSSDEWRNLSLVRSEAVYLSRGGDPLNYLT